MRYTVIINTPLNKEELLSILPNAGVEYIEHGDQTNRDYFANTRWHREDVVEALAQQDIEINDHNIKLVMDYGSQLEENLVHDGWEHLSYIIQDIPDFISNDEEEDK